MSMGPEGGQGAQPGQPGQPEQPGSWPPPAGNTPQWQQGPPQGGWPPPQGPQGPPPWGGPPQPYGFGPGPQQPKKGGGPGVILAIVGGVVALIVVVVVVVAVSSSGGSGDDPKKTSGNAAVEAGQALSRAAGATYTGTYGGSQATFDVTKAGTAHGSYSSHGSQVSRVDINDTTYIKADSSFWTSQGQTSTDADKADGKWAKAPDSASNPKLADFSPAKIAQNLQGAGNDPLAVKTPVGSTPAIKMTSCASRGTPVATPTPSM
jgi:hypothetical protein